MRLLRELAAMKKIWRVGEIREEGVGGGWSGYVGGELE